MFGGLVHSWVFFNSEGEFVSLLWFFVCFVCVVLVFIGETSKTALRNARNAASEDRT